MYKTGFALCCALVASLLVAPATQAQSGAKSKRGKFLWEMRGCGSCHWVGRAMAGPDLNGIQQRRSKDWIRRWLTDTDNMIATDSTAQALYVEYKKARMPAQKISNDDVDALLAYISELEARLKK